MTIVLKPCELEGNLFCNQWFVGYKIRRTRGGWKGRIRYFRETVCCLKIQQKHRESSKKRRKEEERKILEGINAHPTKIHSSSH